MAQDKPRESRIERLQRELREAQEAENAKKRKRLDATREQLAKAAAQLERAQQKYHDLVQEVSALEVDLGEMTLDPKSLSDEAQIIDIEAAVEAEAA